MKLPTISFAEEKLIMTPCLVSKLSQMMEEMGIYQLGKVLSQPNMGNIYWSMLKRRMQGKKIGKTEVPGRAVSQKCPRNAVIAT